MVPSFWPGRRKPQPQLTYGPPVLVSLDLDGSLVGPDSRNTVAMLNRYHQTGQIKTLINTGNSSIARPPYTTALKGLMVDTITIRDGQDRYENPHPEKKTFEQFVHNVRTESAKEPGWAAKLASVWDRRKVAGVIEQTVRESAEAHDIPQDAFLLNATRPRFSVKQDQVRSTDDLKAFVGDVLDNAREAGVPAQYYKIEFSQDGGKYTVALMPKGIDKAEGIEEEIRRAKRSARRGESPFSAVVTLDDAFNGIPQLQRQAYGEPKIPNYATVVGNDPEVREAVQGHPRVVFVKPEEVSRGLEQRIIAAIREQQALLA